MGGYRISIFGSLPKAWRASASPTERREALSGESPSAAGGSSQSAEGGSGGLRARAQALAGEPWALRAPCEERVCSPAARPLALTRVVGVLTGQVVVLRRDGDRPLRGGRRATIGRQQLRRFRSSGGSQELTPNL